jgi:tRNA(Ile2) C34 agmatinyltransferase TiaS
MSSLYQKLLTADVVCRECGSKYGKYSVGCSSMWEGTCDVCDEKKPVTEVRDWGYLTKGLHELKDNIKEQSKEVAEYMANQETEDKVTYKSAITGICIYRKDNFRTLQTEVKLVDEGGGEFISIMDGQGQEVRLDFEEFDEVVKAVALLKNQ